MFGAVESSVTEIKSAATAPSTNSTTITRAVPDKNGACLFPQQRLYFCPLPHGQSSLRPDFIQSYCAIFSTISTCLYSFGDGLVNSFIFHLKRHKVW